MSKTVNYWVYTAAYKRYSSLFSLVVNHSTLSVNHCYSKNQVHKINILSIISFYEILPYWPWSKEVHGILHLLVFRPSCVGGCSVHVHFHMAGHPHTASQTSWTALYSNWQSAEMINYPSQSRIMKIFKRF